MLHPDQQVHPLVLGLLLQRVDPAVVALHAPQGAQVAVGGAHDAWNGRHRLQRHRVVVVLRRIKRKNMRC